jgi:hypothetical protein
VQSAIRTSCFHKAKEYWAVVFKIFCGLAAILDGNERPLSYGSKGFRQVDMRYDSWFRDALVRQRRNDRPIYFFS